MKENFYDWLRAEDEALLKSAALAYAQKGWKVGPLQIDGREPGKRPIFAACPHGVSDFTTDPLKVRGWWTQWPLSNIGLRVPAGVIVVDIDAGGGKTGYEDWAEITAGQHIPDTLTCRTGSGGKHLYFRLPRPGRLRGKLSPNIDLKHGNAYLVAPPSRHKVTEIRYQWSSEAPIAPLPEFLEPLVYYADSPPPKGAPLADKATRARRIVECLAAAEPGNRNHMLYWAACRHFEDDLDIEQELMETARLIGLDEDEISATLRSAEREHL